MYKLTKFLFMIKVFIKVHTQPWISPNDLITYCGVDGVLLNDPASRWCLYFQVIGSHNISERKITKTVAAVFIAWIQQFT